MIFKGSLEDYIYILIGLVWIAFSIYKARQKKSAVAKDEVGKKSGKSFIDQLINDFMTEGQLESTIENYHPNPEQHKAKKVFSYDDIYEESNPKPFTDVIETEQAVKSVRIENKVQKIISRPRKSKPDLRKAIVYSEILNRKIF